MRNDDDKNDEDAAAPADEVWNYEWTTNLAAELCLLVERPRVRVRIIDGILVLVLAQVRVPAGPS